MDLRNDYSGSDFGKYYLIQKIGNGSFGSVYKAFDKVLKVEKALKILEVKDPSEAYKLFSEAEIPYKCRHNNIININSGELVRFENSLVFVIDMDLINGESVEKLLKKSAISVIDSLSIIKNVLFAVEYSHILGIIHRDIKPANILIDNGVPKLADFGLSTALGNTIIPWKWYVTHAAPETFIDNSIATVQTDIFAIGMTLYRMINQISNWEFFLQTIPNYDKYIVNGKLIEKLPINPIVPDKVYKIIKKACQKDPCKRFTSASEMRNAIEKLCPLYNWKNTSSLNWHGEPVTSAPIKDIYIDPKRNYVNVVVCNNGRRSTKDCRRFDDDLSAKKYLFEYVRSNTIL